MNLAFNKFVARNPLNKQETAKIELFRALYVRNLLYQSSPLGKDPSKSTRHPKCKPKACFLVLRVLRDLQEQKHSNTMVLKGDRTVTWLLLSV